MQKNNFEDELADDCGGQHKLDEGEVVDGDRAVYDHCICLCLCICLCICLFLVFVICDRY